MIAALASKGFDSDGEYTGEISLRTPRGGWTAEVTIKHDVRTGNVTFKGIEDSLYPIVTIGHESPELAHFAFLIDFRTEFEDRLETLYPDASTLRSSVPPEPAYSALGEMI